MNYAVEMSTAHDWLEADEYLSRQVEVKVAVVEIRTERDTLPFPEAGICFDAIDKLFDCL